MDILFTIILLGVIISALIGLDVYIEQGKDNIIIYVVIGGTIGLFAGLLLKCALL